MQRVWTRLATKDGKKKYGNREIHSRACLRRHEIQSQYERGSSEGETKGPGKILDHVYRTQFKEDSQVHDGGG